MTGPTESFEQKLTGALDRLADQASLHDANRANIDDIIVGQNSRRPVMGSKYWAFAAAAIVALTLTAMALSRSPANQVVEPVVGGPQVITETMVWLTPGMAEVDALAVGSELSTGPGVVDVVYFDLDATYAEFQEYFEDETELFVMVEPEGLPTSFAVTVSGDHQQFVEWAERLPDVTGVDVGSEEGR